MTPRPPGNRALTAFLAAVAVLVASPLSADDPEFAPYRISAAIRFESTPDFLPAFQNAIREDVRRRIDRTVGERGSLQFAPPSEAAVGSTPLPDLTPASVPVERRPGTDVSPAGLPADTAPDKFLFASVTRSGPAFAVTAREWDRLTDSFGPTRSAAAATRNDLSRAVAAALLAAFRPVARLGEADQESVSLAWRAAGIPPADPSAAPIPPGTILTIHLRTFDREGRLVEIRPVPHTYLESENAAGAKIRSALRRPLSGRRGRVEAWAITAPPSADATRLVVTRRQDGVPLPGRIVEVRPQPPTPGKTDPPPDRTLLTDRAGAVRLAPDPNRPLVWLTVKSGDATLMRLPLAPGVDPEVSLALGDDQRRLDAESRIAIVTGELVETVAKRATLLAKARAAARTARYADADAALAEASGLPDAAAFRRRLAAIDASSAEAAEQAGDRLAAARIRALGRNAASLVDRYLSTDALRVTHEEVEELKRTDPDRK